MHRNGIRRLFDQHLRGEIVLNFKGTQIRWEKVAMDRVLFNHLSYSGVNKCDTLKK